MTNPEKGFIDEDSENNSGSEYGDGCVNIDNDADGDNYDENSTLWLGLFNVQFHTNCAVLREFVQL